MPTVDIKDAKTTTTFKARNANFNGRFAFGVFLGLAAAGTLIALHFAFPPAAAIVDAMLLAGGPALVAGCGAAIVAAAFALPMALGSIKDRIFGTKVAVTEKSKGQVVESSAKGETKEKAQEKAPKIEKEHAPKRSLMQRMFGSKPAKLNEKSNSMQSALNPELEASKNKEAVNTNEKKELGKHTGDVLKESKEQGVVVAGNVKG